MNAMASAGGRRRASEVRILHFGGGRAESLAPGAWPPSALFPTPRHCRGHPPLFPAGAAQRCLKWAPHIGFNWSQAPRSSFRQNGGRHHCYHHHYYYHHQQLLQEPWRRLTWHPPPQRLGQEGVPGRGRRCSAGRAAQRGRSVLPGIRALSLARGGALPLSTVCPSWKWP